MRPWKWQKPAVLALIGDLVLFTSHPKPKAKKMKKMDSQAAPAAPATK